MNLEQKVDRILMLLERIATAIAQDQPPVEECFHLMNENVSDDGWYHCKYCDLQLFEGEEDISSRGNS